MSEPVTLAHGLGVLLRFICGLTRYSRGVRHTLIVLLAAALSSCVSRPPLGPLPPEGDVNYESGIVPSQAGYVLDRYGEEVPTFRMEPQPGQMCQCVLTKRSFACVCTPPPSCHTF